MSLYKLQVKTLTRMMETRSSAKRTERNICASITQYRNAAESLGYSRAEIDSQVKDIRDMFALEQIAEE